MGWTYRIVSDEQLAAGISQTTPAIPAAFIQSYLPALEDAIEQYLNRPLFYQSDVVEWKSPSDDIYILLDRTPVWSITEVRYDSLGGFGQIPDSFGTDSVLTAGEDYYLSIDGRGQFQAACMTGKLFRRNATWGFRRSFKAGLLASARVRANGTVKVTYAGGYQSGQLPAAIGTATVKALVMQWLTLPFQGPLSSEMLGGYNYSRSASADLRSHVFAEVRQLLSPYKRLTPTAGTTSE